VCGLAPPNGYALVGIGNGFVTGSFSKSGGSFLIDHPLDPANKLLFHSFVESPDMKNIYDGVATLDGNGNATVVLPDYFGTLNRDFRYQLTAMGPAVPSVYPYISAEISNNQFTISGAPNGKVSWQVTGTRQDAWAKANPVIVEQSKGAKQGTYIHPELYGQPASQSYFKAPTTGPAAPNTQQSKPE
jgi:hypothetical protein